MPKRRVHLRLVAGQPSLLLEWIISDFRLVEDAPLRQAVGVLLQTPGPCLGFLCRAPGALDIRLTGRESEAPDFMARVRVSGRNIVYQRPHKRDLKFESSPQVQSL